MATVRNPANGDVRVIPDVLVGRYEARGFERVDESPAPASSTRRPARKAAPRKKAAKKAATTSTSSSSSS